MMNRPSDFSRTMQEALSKPFLKIALERATGSFKGGRNRSVAELEEYGELRQQATVAKERALFFLEDNLLRLEESVTAAGGRVFFAADGRAVIDYIINLAREKGLRRVVKGKSMVSEEILLNPHLEAAGLEVLETDLGEYIIQLVGERPSHIIGPAIHKTREEIGRLLQEKLGLAYTENPAEMTRAVRRELRARFLAAELGITGVNFAVAETGTLVLFENEGNIRMSTTLPRVHVAVMGLEKVVTDMRDLSPLLRILPVSAVGQRLPSYVSFITGPRGKQGQRPEELHLIILDGFRTKVLADPVMRPLLRCLRCGACLNFCPVYCRLGGHSYPWVYSGPLGVCLTGAAHGPEAARDIAGASTLCRACGEVCPVMIDLPGIILELRRRLAEGRRLEDLAVEAAAMGLATPLGFDLTGRLLGLGHRLGIDSRGRMRWGPSSLKALSQDRKLPRPSQEPFHRALFKGDEE